MFSGEVDGASLAAGHAPPKGYRGSFENKSLRRRPY
jgi:hypothetical protein